MHLDMIDGAAKIGTHMHCPEVRPPRTKSVDFLVSGPADLPVISNDTHALQGWSSDRLENFV